MTRQLIALVEEAPHPLFGMFLVVIFGPFLLAMSVFAWLVRSWRWRRVLCARSWPCVGHEASIWGLWKCRCGFVREGNVFAPCENCEALGHCPCACGRTIRNPLTTEAWW